MKIEDIKNKLEKYINQRTNFNENIRNNRQLFKQQTRAGKSAYLLNALMHKHADAMDNFPEVVVLPRMQDDIRQAEQLSLLIPIILRLNDYEDKYSRLWWNILVDGIAAQSVLWDRFKNKGLGDIAINNVDILRLYFDFDVENIENSECVFYISTLKKSKLKKRYKNIILKDEDGFLDKADDECELIDCYFKQRKNGKTSLELIKFCQNNIIYDSTKEDHLKDKGIYQHGRYPFVIISPYASNKLEGFALMDIIKGTQAYIDSMNSIVERHAKMASKKRFFIRPDGNVNEAEFADWNRDFVHVAGNIDDDSIREININPLDDTCFRMLVSKIDELRELSGNTELNQGFVSKGITAASAIAALQEAGSKLSRDMLKSSFRSFKQLCYLCVELIRQFYKQERCLNIIEGSKASFINFSSIDMQEKIYTVLNEEIRRLPEYDIIIKAQKASPFSTLAQNELAKEFFRLGFFEAQNASAAKACIAMMNFEGKDQVLKNIDNISKEQFAEQHNEY